VTDCTIVFPVGALLDPVRSIGDLVADSLNLCLQLPDWLFSLHEARGILLWATNVFGRIEHSLFRPMSDGNMGGCLSLSVAASGDVSSVNHLG
jgi:hypothetical protein